MDSCSSLLISMGLLSLSVIAARASAIRRAILALSVSKMADTYAVRQADEEVSLTKPTFGRYRRTVRLRTEDRYT